ncbi:hypothetical protein F2P79_025724 [Pimephales promelas]|nr:hypothetical protein F2P79_025724 [Pimephales promelas]
MLDSQTGHVIDTHAMSLKKRKLSQDQLRFACSPAPFPSLALVLSQDQPALLFMELGSFSIAEPGSVSIAGAEPGSAQICQFSSCWSSDPSPSLVLVLSQAGSTRAAL